MSDLITCPRCTHSFELASAVRARIESDLTRQLEADAQRRIGAAVAAVRDEVRREVDARVTATVAEQMRSKDEQLASLQKRVTDLAERERALVLQQRALDDRIQEEKTAAERRINEARVTAREIAAKEAQERIAEIEKAAKLREQEQALQLEQMKRAVDEAQRKAQQGSQQIQGEAQELVLADALQRAFPRDRFVEVSKGTRGADLVQHVCDDAGRECGRIVWESKRTKAWQDGWVTKLREDSAAVSATHAVIVTETLPANVRHFAERDGVWVTGWSHAAAVASILRATVIEVDEVRRAIDGREEKQELVYAYLTSPRFHQRMENAITAFAAMYEDLGAEKRVVAKLWAKREKQIERAGKSLAAFVGDLQGIAGDQMAEIASLEIPLLGDGESDDENDDDSGSIRQVRARETVRTARHSSRL
jgi:hypothetical protein